MLKIRKYQRRDAIPAALLIIETYKKFNSTEYFDKKAVQKYVNFYNPKKIPLRDLTKKFYRSPIFFVAADDKKIIGLIRGDRDRIVNLFVKATHHRSGIGKKLVQSFLNAAKKLKSKEIKIRSSLFAAPFYQKMGFKKTTGIRNFRGLKSYPMKKRLV